MIQTDYVLYLVKYEIRFVNSFTVTIKNWLIDDNKNNINDKNYEALYITVTEHISQINHSCCVQKIYLQLSVVVTFSTVALDDGSWGMPVEKDNAIINETAN